MAWAYLLLILGVLLDEATTYLGLSQGLVELNPYAASLISRGLWPLIDIALIIAVILLTEYVDNWAERRLGRRVFILLPILLGGLRLMAGLHNLFNLFLL